MPNIRVRSKNRTFIALIPAEALDPNGRAIGFSVVVTQLGVAMFCSQWPCNGIHDAPVRFEFASNGDLVGITNEPKNADGAAMVALSHDAQAFGESIIEHRRAERWPRQK